MGWCAYLCVAFFCGLLVCLGEGGGPFPEATGQEAVGITEGTVSGLGGIPAGASLFPAILEAKESSGTSCSLPPDERATRRVAACLVVMADSAAAAALAVISLK